MVEYIADDHGFRAVVKKIGTPIHPEPAPIVHQPAPIIAAPAPAPVPEPIIVAERQPTLYDGYDAYNGHYQNYVPAPALPAYAAAPAPVEVPQAVIPKVYQQYEPAQLAPAPYYPVPKPLEERVEYHGFTGNDNDDSAYTKYAQEEEGDRGYGGYGGYEQGYSFGESRPQLVSVPYKLAADYEKPLVYYLQQKY